MQISKEINQKETSERAGISEAFLSEILNGNKLPSPRVAKELERVTGISRLAWLYPNEHKNPLLKKKNREVAS